MCTSVTFHSSQGDCLTEFLIVGGAGEEEYSLIFPFGNITTGRVYNSF